MSDLERVHQPEDPATVEEIATTLGIEKNTAEEPLLIKARAAGEKKFSNLYSALNKFFAENAAVRGYVAFHLAIGSGVLPGNLASMKFDLPKGEIMQFLREWASKNLNQ